ncbi:enoyl-CoA hydratase-related protein [Alphaproteobacteria bacterium]|nr:enoyl-CoA hydratase-related protein [Alphaproteobacteria bacterium]
MENNLLIDISNNILNIKFNRPESRNAITRDMFEKLLKTLENCKKNNSIRAIFLSGAGDAFSAGGDVKDMATREDNSSLQEKTYNLRRIMGVSELLYSLPIPTISIINGPAAGAAFAIALSCDMRIATNNAKFVTAFSKIAFSGDFGGSFFLTKIVGTAKARELYYLSDIIDASEAKSLGIVNKVIEESNIDDYVKAMKLKFQNLPPIAIKYMKKNLNNAELGNLDLSLNDEALYMMICSETEDHKNAAKAFVNKEKVVFKGI